MKSNRRSFLKAAGATAAIAPLAACDIGRLETRPEDLYPEGWPAHQERWVASLCDMCPGGCGVELRVLDGRVVGLRGNPRSPVSRGGLCPRAFGLIQVTHHPERVRSPLKRAGDGFQPVSWEQALDEVAQGLRAIRSQRAPERLAIIGGSFRGLFQEALERFATAFGTPNLVRDRRYDYDQPALAPRLSMGVSLPVSYDLSQATYVLSFGGSLLEDGACPVYQMRAIAEGRSRVQDPVRYVEVGARPSVSAGKADRWLPVKSGREAAVALGMAYVIVREGLYDRRFIEESTHGFDDWVDADGNERQGFKSWILENHPPKVTQELTGLPLTTIIEEARWFAQSTRPLAIGEPPDAFGGDDARARLAILALNALVGAMGQTGGLLMQPAAPVTRLPEPELDDVAREGRGRDRLDGAGIGEYRFASDAIQNLPRRLQEERPYPVEMLLLVRSNPAYDHPLRGEFGKALEKVPLVVSITSFLDESAQHADLVLPESTPLESWTEDEVSHLAGFTAVTVGRPAMPPTYGSRPAYEILAELATRMGDPVARALPEPKLERAIKARVEGLWKARRGYVIRKQESEELRRVIQNQGYWYREHGDFDAFFEQMVEAGGWWDPDNAIPAFRRSYPSPTGRYEFDSSVLRKEMAEAGTEEATGLPVYRPLEPAIPSGAAENYPYQLAPFTLVTSLVRHGINVPLLQELPSPRFEDQAWLPWIEIDPRLARRHGIHDEDRVRVVSPKGSVETIARLVPGNFDDVVHMPTRMGHASTNRWTERAAAEPAEILMDVTDRLQGVGVRSATFVRLEKS